jgi:2-polyprenyl-3-methyl-5-hydroxy-6-metoxy-1,4-benzoquinol methylase|tara:strand:+ start:8257 stop:9039 length:783 start_codon:yes stop_codon:yes gene_type:complete
MRETFRSLDNFDYWEKRWESIEADDAMINKDKYPLKYTLETIKLNNSNQKILEAGCGAGRILKYLNDLKFNVVGIDFIKTAIDKIKKNDPNIIAYTQNIMKTSFKDKEFDTILAFGLYHNFKLDEVILALKETKRILNDNGYIFFSFRKDNIQNLILDNLRTKKKLIDPKFHKLNLKEKELIQILEDLNLKIVKKYYIINMPLLFHFKIFRSSTQKKFNEHIGRREGYSLNFIGSIINYFLSNFFSKNYCNVLGIICRKN